MHSTCFPILNKPRDKPRVSPGLGQFWNLWLYTWSKESKFKFKFLKAETIFHRADVTLVSLRLGTWEIEGHFTIQDWEPVTTTLRALSLVETAEPVQVRFTLCLRDHQSMWMHNGCKVYVDSYMASIGLCFMVTGIILKTRFLEVGLIENR